METKTLSSNLVDAGACDALGALSPAESAAYQQELASAGELAGRMDRDLREVVARLSATSPHMEPPSDLRGRILQATAPVTFKMEDYRKATHDGGKWYRRGFYAAMMFLMAGAYYNYVMQTSLVKANAVATAAAQHVQQLDQVVASFVSSDYQPMTFMENGKLIGKALVNEKEQRAVMIVAPGTVPPGKALQLSMPVNGKTVVFQTVMVTAPENALHQPENGVERVMAVKTVLPDNEVKPQRAGQ